MTNATLALIVAITTGLLVVLLAIAYGLILRRLFAIEDDMCRILRYFELWRVSEDMKARKV